MKLRTKFVVVLLGVALLLSSATVGGLELYKDDLLDRTRADVDESARLAADQVATEAGNQVDYVGYMASRPESANFSRSRETLTEVTSRSRFVAAELVAADGTVVDFRGPVSDAQREEIVGSNVSDTAHFRQGRLTASLAATEYDADRDAHLVVISAPVFDAEGDLKGVLAASLYVTGRTLLGPVVPLDTGSQNVYVTAGGDTLYGSDGEFDRGIAASAPAGDTGWTVRVVRDRSRLDDRFETLALAQGAGLFVVFLMVVSLGVWQYRATLRQADRLLSGFAALRGGDHDYRVSLSAGEEWEQISDGFNDLAEGLADREAALRDREQRLSVLNRFLRHNLRNDMNVVIGFAEHVRDTSDEEGTVGMAERIVEKGRSMVETGEKARLIENSIDDADLTVVDLGEAARDAVADLREEYPGATFETGTTRVGDAGEGVVAGDGGAGTDAGPGGDDPDPDSDPVEAVALSSVSTAVRLVAENGVVHNDGDDPTVSVAVGSTGDRARVTVADDGPGIPEYELETLRQGAETPLQHGSGLGLWVTRWIVDRSGGDLSFPEFGEGAVVRMTFAAADGDVDPDGLEPPAPAVDVAEDPSGAGDGSGRGEEDEDGDPGDDAAA